MGKSVNNVFAPSDYAVSTAPQSASLPTALATSSTVLNLPTGWYDVGYLSDAGVTEAHTYNEQQVYDMAGALLRVLRNQEQRQWTFECVENDAVVHGLMYPGTSVTTTGATAEVQTVTISGSPTGGTFTLSLAGFPAMPAQTYNVSTAALTAAILQYWDLTVGVTGTAGSSYVVTFPTSAGNVAQMSATGAFTGGSSPTISVVTTTPGVTGVNSRVVGRGVARNLRYFCIDLFDGTVTERYLVTQGEAVWTGSVTYSGSALKIAQFQLNTFFDSTTGGFYTRLDNNVGSALTFS